ncbi:hypothetical protein Dda_1565 [Drechslerella dactyloides]|uniref:Uncharacterized protein n=1 Tax=Drechslerella dactyloides TaxID=74499 RepID=A0AAD6J6D3_DREDA|nr:hypothetical protein Dda_1565 [Drechslerella dactyloides]
MQQGGKRPAGQHEHDRQIRRVRIKPGPISTHPQNKKSDRGRKKAPLQLEVSEGSGASLSEVTFAPIPNTSTIGEPNPRNNQEGLSENIPDDGGEIDLGSEEFAKWVAEYEPMNPDGSTAIYEEPPAHALLLGEEQFWHQVPITDVALSYDPECSWCLTARDMLPHLYRNIWRDSKHINAFDCPFWNSLQKVMNDDQLNSLPPPNPSENSTSAAAQDPATESNETEATTDEMDTSLDPRLLKIADLQKAMTPSQVAPAPAVVYDPEAKMNFVAPRWPELSKEEGNYQFQAIEMSRKLAYPQLQDGVDTDKVFRLIFDQETGKIRTGLEHHIQFFKKPARLTLENLENLVTDARALKHGILEHDDKQLSNDTLQDDVGFDQTNFTINESLPSRGFGALIRGLPTDQFDAALDAQYDRYVRGRNKKLDPEVLAMAQEFSSLLYSTDPPTSSEFNGQSSYDGASESRENAPITDHQANATSSITPRIKLRVNAPKEPDFEDEEFEDFSDQIDVNEPVYVTHERPSDCSHLTKEQLAADDLRPCFRISQRSYRRLHDCLLRAFASDSKLERYTLGRPDSKRRFTKRISAALTDNLEESARIELANPKYRERNAWMVYVMAVRNVNDFKPEASDANADDSDNDEEEKPKLKAQKPAVFINTSSTDNAFSGKTAKGKGKAAQGKAAKGKAAKRN